MAGDRILDGLNDAQREAVTHDAGPLLIIAGAGTGKTTVITRRIAWLIARRKARPEEILALTFTDKAAAEMEERVDQLVPYGYADVEISTFHAFGDRILREHSLEVGLAPDFRVLSRAEQVIFFRDRLFEFPLERYRPLGDPTRHIQAIISLISRCKDEDISPAEYHAIAERLRLEAAGAPEDDEIHDRAAQQAELAATFARYQELMARESAVDFGDQIVLALNLLRARARGTGAGAPALRDGDARGRLDRRDDRGQGRARGVALRGRRRPRAVQSRRRFVPALPEHARHPVDVHGQRRPLRPARSAPA